MHKNFTASFANLTFFMCLFISLKVSFFGNMFTDEPLPKDGYVELPHDKSGFGVTLNR